MGELDPSDEDLVAVGEPHFLEKIQNITVTAGREAILSCVVGQLGDHKVSYGENIYNALVLHSSTCVSWRHFFSEFSDIFLIFDPNAMSCGRRPLHCILERSHESGSWL